MSTPNVDGNLSRWVSQVQQQHSGAGSTPAGPLNRGAAEQSTERSGGAGASTADELEDEFRRARQERLKRRSQLGSGAGGGSNVSGSSLTTTVPSAAPTPETPSLSGDETLRKLLGERGLTSPTVERSLSTSATPNIAQSPITMSSTRAAAAKTPATSGSYGASPPKKSNALLDRYGGVQGPTGVARAGSHDAPASLASFMGGKASGPRLGKLVGDGRSAPPEASQIDQTRHALPGMTRMPPPPSPTRAGASPLASFLEARAAASGHVIQASSNSPPKVVVTDKREAQSNNRGATSWSWQSSAQSAPQAHNVPTPLRSTSPDRLATSHRTDMGTSPLKDGDVKDIRILSPTQGTVAHLSPASLASSATAGKGAASALSPGTIVHSPTADALARFPELDNHSPPLAQEPAASTAFLATQSASSERLPTASLTRLRSKKMVEQRIREAQDRGNSQDSTSPNRSPAADEAATSDRPPWTPESANLPAPQRYMHPTSASATVPGRWQASNSPSAGLSHALPGLGSAVGGGGPPTHNLYAVNRKTPGEEAVAHAAPVRLPGMGGISSPFEARSRAATTELQSDEQSTPLEPLARGRAKPKRAVKTATTALPATNATPRTQPVEEALIDRDAFANARQAFGGVQRAALPVKSTQSTGLSVDAMHLQRRQDSMPTPDSATGLADSAAALEALVAGRTVKTPPPPAARASVPAQSGYTARTGTLKIAKNSAANSKVDYSALLASFDALQSRSNVFAAYRQTTVSIEVFSIEPNGITKTLSNDDAVTLYKGETQVITHRFKESATSGVISTRVYARAGRSSRLLASARNPEAAKVMEIAQRYRVPATDARQGRESAELVRAMGGCLVTREGQRDSQDGNDKANASLFQVRGAQGCLFVDQVDMLTASLCSALSVVVSFMGDVFVWHGRGATPAIRQGALRFASTLRRGSSEKTVVGYEEGDEDEFFWTCFDRQSPYSDAWHHRFLPGMPEEQTIARLFSIEQGRAGAKLTEQSPFSALDVHRDGVYLLQLPMEAYVLVGPDARSIRHSIAATIEAGTALSRHVAQKRGPQHMVMPVHVVVFPSIVPREVKSAFRYWHDEHLNGERWQRMRLRMNVWERREAQEQLERSEHNLSDLDDDLFLPVGVGLDDIRGLDI